MAHHGVATEDFFRASVTSVPADMTVADATGVGNVTQATHHSATTTVPGLHDVFFDVAGNAAVHLEHAVSSAHGTLPLPFPSSCHSLLLALL
eukprot:COSAG02_NODE_13424_length_1397_cov_0.795069_1_plen_91_part_10